MAPVSNRFAKYIIQQDDAGGGGSAPAPKQNRFAKYKTVEAPAVQQTNPMVAQGQVAQQEWQAAGAKHANPNPENPIVTAQRSSQTQAMSQWAQQREAERQAEAARTKARRESAAAFGGGMDMLPTEDEAGNVRPGTAVDTDISKGVVGAPFQALEAVKDAGVSMANLGGETYNAVNNALTAPFGVKPMQVPKITTPDNPLIGEGGPLQSVTGDLGRNLMQFLIARKIVGNIAPGGGTAAQLGKDAVALGAGFDADTARLSETVNEFVQKSGSPQIAKDYIGWLAERDPSNPLLERFKNMVEDLTISGPLVAPQAVARGAQAVGNALAPVARTPTNAGGTAARAAVADPYLVRNPAPSPVATPAASAAPQAPVTSVPATRAVPQPPVAPVAPAANAAPPPGTLTPVPTANAATAEFNALPRKVRESVFRAMRNSGFDNNGVIAAIRDLNTLPPERQSMFATELVRKYGAQFPELEANLAAMGRKFAVDTPKPRQIFGRTIERDGARQVMNDEVRSQIDSEAGYLNNTVERLFGPGAVPAKEELLRLQQAGGAEYRRLLSTTNRYGRARAPAKRAEIDRNIATLASYLKRPEVMNNVPDWVKQKVMLEVSNDLRQLKFTPDEQAIIVAGDPGLAALFTPDAPLTYSPQLWNTLVDLYPTQSAHSLQSAYAKAIREARFSSDPQTRVWVDTLSRARGKSTVRANARNADDRGFGLLKMLEDAVPGYKEARMKYGNVMGAQEALDDARQFMSIAGDETKLAQFIDDYEDLSDLQRTAVENQVSSIIRQSIANKVDNPKLAELGREGPSTPNLTAISKQPFLDALPKVFGAKGQEMADAIRMARSNTDYLTGLHPKYNSRTGVNEADVKNADRIYEDPAGAESSIIDNAVTQGLGGAGLGAAFIPGAAGAAIPLIGLAAAKALWTARKAGKRLSPSEKTQLAEFLFRSRRQGGNAAEGGTPPGGPPQLPGPRGPSPLDTGGNMAAGAAIGAAVGGAASNGDPNAMLAGAAVGATGGALRARARNSSSLIPVSKPKNALAVAGGSTPSPTNALATPSRPPVKAGFGGSKQPLPMDEAGGKNYIDQAVEHFGVTDDLREAGYLLPDGRMLDLSGRHDMLGGDYVRQDGRNVATGRDWQAGVRHTDHRELPFDVQEAKANEANFGNTSTAHMLGFQKETGAIRIMPGTGISVSVMPSDKQIKALVTRWRRTYGNDPMLIDVDDAVTGKNLTSIDVQRVTVEDVKNALRQAPSPPSQSGSSKLLAGMGASPEGLGAAAGGAAGYVLNPTDANGDGVIDDADRGLNAMGGLISGGLGVKAVRSGAGAVRAQARNAASLIKPTRAPNALASPPARPPAKAGFGGNSFGGPVSSQIAPPLAAATIASVGPEGENPEDKWTRMAAAAALAVGVRNLPALRKFASEARGVNQATFGGVNAKTADLKLQRIAQDMEKAGASRDQIWKETGWFKGNDGKWRFEIDDSGARLRSNEEVSAIGESMVQTARDLEARVKQSNASLREQPDLFPAALKRAHSEMRKRAKGIREKAGENFGPQWNEYNGRRLEYDLDHPAMIAAYPQLARDLIISRPGPSRHSPTLKGSYSDNRIKLNGPRNSNQTSTTLHETQHALQDVEGFAQGGSPESAYMADGLRQEWAQEIDKILTPAPFEKFAANPVFDGVAEAEVRRQYKTMVDEMRAASKDIYHPLSKTVQQTAAYNIYKRLAGEVEARNVQTRRDFTPEERRARPPWTTQDVPDDQQIVRYGTGQANSLGPWGRRQAGFGGSSKSLDMSEAARMQRAREQGFDTKRVAYRGLNRSYDEGGGGRRYQMFTSSESDAAEYGSNIVAAYLRKGNNLQLDGGGRNFNSVLVSQLPDDVRAKLHPSIQGVARIDDIADAAQKAGYDSVTVENVFDNSWGEIPPKPRARTQKDIDELNAILDELGVEALPAEATPRVKTLEKNYDPVTIDVVFDTKNIRSTDAAFDPSQSGSSKLLAGLGASPEGIGAAGGATYGYLANPTDANGDGVIDDQDRGLNAMGGLVSGGLGVKAVRSGANAARNAMIPQARVMAEAATPVGISAIRKSSFTAKDGTSYSVDFEKVKGGGVEVTFHPESGPRATTSAMQDEYAPLANGTLSDAVEVFRNVEKAIKDDIATKGEARYILQGRTKRQRDLYSQFARTRKAPDGYSWKVEQRPGERDLLTLVREGTEERMPPAQAGFGGGGKGPPNALAGPPKKPAPVLSRAAEEATRELKAARSAYNRAANKWVMKDDRELRVKPLEERVVAAEKRLAEVLKNDARIKVAGARIKGTVEKTLNSQVRSVATGVGLGAVGSSALLVGYNALNGEDKRDLPMSPSNPAYYWTELTKDRDGMVRVQTALREWGEWPDDVDLSGTNGKITKAAIRSWRARRGLDPDAPMRRADVARLLAGPKGYQDGKIWRYGDGAQAQIP